MIVFKTAAELKFFIDDKKKNAHSLGFVPTMGALHNGHISLIKICKQQNQITVCSIFVNPTQFNDKNDFEKYPKTLEKDIDLLQKNECDVLFLPSVKEIYPTELNNLPHYNLGYIENLLEGKYRPGHYQGVCQVVHRLLQIVKPNNLYLGQKDYQQCMVIKKLIALMGVNINVVICDTLRETDGLAMSSRNMRLNALERNNAVTIYNTLQFVKKSIKPGNLDVIKKQALQFLQNKGFKIDYVEIANATNLNPIQNWDGNEKIVALIAAYLNEIRLIDNMILN